MEPKTELQKNAIAAFRRAELESYQRALDVQWLDNRMDDGGMNRCLALIQREAEMEKDFQERTDHAAIVNERARKETILGLEVAKVRRQESLELLRRHYLRERDPSLRDLMKKLQAGYVRRDQQLQILHNEYKRLQDKAEDQYASKVVCDALYNEAYEADRLARLKHESSTSLRRELQQQLVNRQQARQCEFEDMLIEKKMLDDINRTIYDEDMRELEQKRRLQEQTKREMVTFQQAKMAWRDKQRTVAVNEERALEEQIRAMGDREAAIIAERQRKVREKEELNAVIVAKILADEAARKERVDIIKQLQEQEQLEKDVQQDIKESEKEQRVKRETMQTLQAQFRSTEARQQEERKRDDMFRELIEAKMQADDDKEREKDAKQREKQQKYARELKQQIEDNAEKRKREKEMEDARAKAVFDWDKRWREEADIERSKIVAEHVPPLMGFLQPGAVTTQDLAVTGGSVAVAGGSVAAAVGKRPTRFPKCNAQCRVLRRF